MAAYIPFGNDTNHKGYQALNLRLHNITSVSDLAAEAGGLGGGMIGFMSANGNKRITFYDDQLAALVVVPRLDRAESVTAKWSFSAASPSAPFDVVSNIKVTNLNADLLDGHDADSTANINTIALRDSVGRLKAAAPNASDDLTTKDYVDNVVSGLLSPKTAARVFANANVNISSAPASIDGVTLATNNRIGLGGQTAPAENGLWIFNGTGSALTRATDADTAGELPKGTNFLVTEGATWMGTRWQLVSTITTLGTDPADFVQIGAVNSTVAGPGAGKNGNEIYVKLGSAGSPAGYTYTQGGLVYCDSASTLNQTGTLTGILKGNGSSAPSAIAIGTGNQLLGVNNAASGYEYKSVAGTTNQITVTHAANLITLSTPQNIHTGASPTFAGLNLSAFNTGSVLFVGGSGALAQNNSQFFWDNTNNRLGIGTTSPKGGLQINASISSTGTQNARIASTVGAGGSVVDGLHLDCNPDTAYDKGISLSFGLKHSSFGEYTSRIIHYGNSNATRSSKLQIQTHSSTQDVWNTGLLMDDIGNVGIKTLSPRSVLDVNGTLTISENSTLAWCDSGSRDMASILGVRSDDNTGYMIFRTRLSGTPTERMRIDTAGNVGIGLSNPAALLHAGQNLSSAGTQTVRISTAAGSAGTVVDALHLDCNPDTAYDKGVSISLGQKYASVGELTSRIIHYANAINALNSKLQIQTHSGTQGIWNTGLLMDHVGNVVVGDTTANAQLSVVKNNIGTTPANLNGLLLENTSAAAVNAQQISPGLRFRGFGWKSAATAGSQSLDIRNYLVPVQGVAAPTAYLLWEASINGGGYAELARLDSVTGLRLASLSTGAIVQTDGGKNLISSNSLPSGTTLNGLTIVRQLAATVGDGSSTSFVVTHNLGTNDVEVTIYDLVASTKDTVFVPHERTSTNSVTVRFGYAPSSNQYRILVRG